MLARGWPALWGALLGGLLVVVARDAMPDDALITLAFARSVVQDGCLCLTDGVSINTMTSPLHLALLVPPLWVGLPPFLVVGGLLVVELAAVAWCLRRLAGTTPALLGPALLATSPVFGSAVGMETFLAAAVVVALVTAGQERRLVLAGVLCAAAVLTRPDLVVVVIAVVAVLAAGRGRRLLWALPIGAAVSLPWFVWSWWRLGSAWPHTVAIKSEGDGWSGTHLWDGVPGYYWPTFPGVTAVTLATLVAGLLVLPVAWRTRSWPALALAAGGASSLLALAVTEAPPTAYYAGPAIAGLGLAAAVVAGRWRPAEIVGVGLVAASLGVAAAHGPLWAEGLAPIRQNWATNSQYAAIAAALPRDGVIMSNTEIGALAYYCQDHGCRVTDEILSDPTSVDRTLQRWRARHPAVEWNYAHYRPGPVLPIRYRLDFGEGDLRDPDTWPITRAPGFHQIARLVPLP